MISDASFQTAIHVLDCLTSPSTTSAPTPVQFEDYKNYPQITTAIKIINKAAKKGTKSQKNQLFENKQKIKSLNILLQNPTTFAIMANDKFGIQMGDEANQIQGIKIALPQTKFEKLIQIATKIPRIACAIFLEILTLPISAVLTFIACCKLNFNPKDKNVKNKQTPILLLHGSNFNETGWLIGRQFLKKKEYGSVFSLNYDGILSNDPNKGIDDYAKDKISAEIKRIKLLTGSDRVILIGHSMGGLIAGYYAENCSATDQVKIEHVISLATPWQGAPILDLSQKLGKPFSKTTDTKRHQQMSVKGGGTFTTPRFRQDLVAQALDSERQGTRKYYNIWSTTDYAVPTWHGNLTEDPRRQRSFSYLNHCVLVAWPSVWTQTRSWLNQIYASEQSA